MLKRLIAPAVSAVLVVAGAAWPAEGYLPGGPLAGIELPLYKTQHGEPPGYPGCLRNADGTFIHPPQEMYPEFELYPGSVEHWRAYWFKYCPVRSFFDRQSMLKNFTAPNIPGARKGQIEEYAEPVYWVPRQAPEYVSTGKFNKPVPVVRCKAGDPIFLLDLGELQPGLYAVRVIAAVETKELRFFRKPLYLTMTVNDGIGGEAHTCRIRVGSIDEFYSIAEVYFHAPAKRAYKAQLAVDRGSEVDLLVHNITLDDVLAGVDRRPIKKRMTLTTPQEKARIKPHYARFADVKFTNTPQERLARDEAVWKAFPPLNAQAISGAWVNSALKAEEYGVADKTRQQIEEEFGKWEPANPEILTADAAALKVFLVNKKLGLVYTVDDLWARKPLPDPYPYKDDGAGLFFPDPKDPAKGRFWSPIAEEVRRRQGGQGNYRMAVETAASAWVANGNADMGRDGAIALIRMAYQFPAFDSVQCLSEVSFAWRANNKDTRFRRRETLDHIFESYSRWYNLLHAYDSLYDYIKGNEDLARSVQRFVPWVTSSQDVIALLDGYLVQTSAKRVLRYQYYTGPGYATLIFEPINTLAVNEATDPWMEWFFARTWTYPLAPAGYQDLMIVSNDRDGIHYIGSTGYGKGENAALEVKPLETYLALGGNRKYDLSDARRYPKPVAACAWPLRGVIGGADMPRVGDVAGPDKQPGYLIQETDDLMEKGWQWTGDPRFAWTLKYYYGRQGDAAIDAAAAEVPRAPWLDNVSRVLPNWAAILESGLEHDDYRFRRAAYVRVGRGYGHAHNDSLDLQFFAHGLPMTIDGGQRSSPKYSDPKDLHTRVHNVVEVDNQNNSNYSWARAVSDMPGARYLCAQGLPPAGARLFRRQLALIDVDEGQGSRKLRPQEQIPRAKLDKGVTAANSYIFDVFRVAGGKSHSYCFHGPVNDDFQWNALHVVGLDKLTDADRAYLGLWSIEQNQQTKAAGDGPAILEATWRYARENAARQGMGSEKFLLQQNFDPQAPAKFTRLHLFHAAGLRAYRAQLICTQWGYDFTCLMARRTSDQPIESAFAAVIEPYAGQPFIRERRPLTVANNESDALRAVAVEVQTVNGRRDLCFVDGRPETVRTVAGGADAAPVRIAGEFAYLSADDQGLRHAALTGGTLLEAPLVKIEVAARERLARVVRTDYLQKKIWLDQLWPARTGPSVIEIGTLPENGEGYTTSYNVASVQPDGRQSMLVLLRGADYYRSQIKAVAEEKGEVACVLEMPVMRAGGKNWFATNEKGDRAWRAEYLGGANWPGFSFRLSGGPVKEADFAPDNALRLWEYGVGDTVRRSTSVSLRRLPEGVWALETDVDVTISLPAAAIEALTPGGQWRALEGRRDGEWVGVRVLADEAAQGPVKLRLVKEKMSAPAARRSGRTDAAPVLSRADRGGRT